MLTGEMRRNPHVQSYVVATDQVGLLGCCSCAALAGDTQGCCPSVAASAAASASADWHCLGRS